MCYSINQFYATGLLYPLKTENLCISDVFSGYWKISDMKWVKFTWEIELLYFKTLVEMYGKIPTGLI